MALVLKLEAFEGPLDLLLHLIDKNRLNIYDIPIADVTEQYLEHLQALEGERMEAMSEFIEMAATLLRIKSEMLLPKPETESGEGEDPRQELVEKLLEYKKFKLISKRLKAFQEDAGRSVFKAPSIPEEILNFIPQADPEALLADLDFNRLYRVFRSVMKRQVDKVDKVRSGFGEIKRSNATIQDKADELLALGQPGGRYSFAELIRSQRGKIEKIVMFLAVLELMKAGTVRIIQEAVYDDITILFN